MALDFPNNPAVDQVFDHWKWDGDKWISLGAAATSFPEAPENNLTYARRNADWARSVAVAGDTMTGNLSLPSLSASGNVSASGFYYGGSTISLNSASGLIYTNGAVQAGGNISGSALSITNAANVGGTVTATGAVINGVCNINSGSCFGQYTPDRILHIGRWLAGFDTGYSLYMTGAGCWLGFMNGWYFYCDRVGGNFSFEGGSSIWTQWRNSDGAFYNVRGWIGGQGGHVDISDVRSKQNIAPCMRGLEDVLKLKPVEFERRDLPGQENDKSDKRVRRRELGFVAQDLLDVIPEAVTKMGIVLDADGTGSIDSDSPTLGMSDTPLIAALVNAVKELSARVKDLETRA